MSVINRTGINKKKADDDLVHQKFSWSGPENRAPRGSKGLK